MGDFVEMDTRKQEHANETISLVYFILKSDIIKDGSGLYLLCRRYMLFTSWEFAAARIFNASA